jgi:hypothetical protein
MNLLGSVIFRQNQFILYSSNSEDVALSVKRTNVSIYDRAISFFKDYSFRLHMKFLQPLLGDAKANFFFLMLLEDADVFVTIIKMLQFIMHPRTTFLFDVRGAGGSSCQASLRAQRLLLKPFEKLLGPNQTCTVRGLVDAHVATDLEDKLASPIHWVWSQYHHVLEYLRIKAALTHRALQYEHFAIAQSIVQSSTVIPNTRIFKSMMASGHNLLVAELGTAMQRAMRTDMLVYLARATRCQNDKEARVYCESVLAAFPASVLRAAPPDQTEGLEVLHGIARVGLQQFATAQDHFEHALRRNSKEALALIGIEECRIWRARPRSVRITAALSVFGPGLSAVIIQPWKLTSSIFSAAKDQELYALRELGYVGDTLDGTVKQKIGWSVTVEGKEVPRPFDKAEIDEWLAPHLAAQASCDRSGLKRPQIIIEWPRN